MSPAAFRKTALSFPETVEAFHMGHPDFRVRGKIFASLGPDEDWGMAKLTLEQQAPLVQDQPASSNRRAVLGAGEDAPSSS